MQFNTDLTNFKDRRGSYVTPGTYLVEIDSVEGQESSAGNQMAVMALKVVNGQSKGSILIDRLVNTEKALFRVVNFLEALTGKPVPRKNLQINTDDWLGKVIGVVMEDNEYNGRIRSQVAEYLTVAQAKKALGGGETPSAPADLDTANDTATPASTEASEDAADAVSDDGSVDMAALADL